MGLVLFVDDDEIFLKSVHRSLMHLVDDWEMKFLTDTTEALSCISKGEDAVIVLDWMMPDMDGLDFAERARAAVRKKEADAQLYIIMLSAKQDIRDAVFALESGIDDYMSKPFDTRELVARVLVGFRLLEGEYRLRLKEKAAMETWATNLKLEKEARQASKLAQQAEAAHREQSGLLDNMSEEIGEPLKRLIAVTRQLIATELNQEQRGCAEEIEETSHTVLRVIDNLLVRAASRR